MSLDLNLFGLGQPRTRGRSSRELHPTQGRELTSADLALLDTERGITAPALTRIRDSHHSLARCLATGMKPAEASIVTGYSGSRISILQADPAFRELVEFYRANTKMAFADVHDRMAALNLDALQELQRRVEEDGENMSAEFLLDLVKLLADRTGHGPQTKSTNVNVNVDIAARMEAGRRRAEEFRQGLLDLSWAVSHGANLGVS
jgi:hypothetical protein